MIKSNILLLILFISSIIQAQNIMLGCRLESNIMRFSGAKGNTTSTMAPTAVQANAVIFPIDFIGFELRLGAERLNRYYYGTENGMLVRVCPTKFFYLTAGIINHYIFEDGHNGWERYDKTLHMGGYGIGSNFYGPFVIELMYLNSGTVDVGWERNDYGVKIRQSIHRIVKVGFGCSFFL